jgi:hypothetical protein
LYCCAVVLLYCCTLVLLCRCTVVHMDVLIQCYELGRYWHTVRTAPHRTALYCTVLYCNHMFQFVVIYVVRSLHVTSVQSTSDGRYCTLLCYNNRTNPQYFPWISFNKLKNHVTFRCNSDISWRNFADALCD